MDRNQALQWIKPPLCDLRKQVECKIRMKANNRWNSLPTCEISRKTWPNYDESRTKKLKENDRKTTSLLVGVLTGHNPLRYHTMKLNLSTDDIWRGCGDAESCEETPHFLCHSPSLSQLRNRTLGSTSSKKFLKYP